MQRPRGPRFLPVRPDEEHRTNRQIRVPEVRLIGLKGEQLGVVKTEDALRMAQEGEVDLVEVAPGAAVIMVGPSRSLRKIPWLKLAELSPRRFLLTIVSGGSQLQSDSRTT